MGRRKPHVWAQTTVGQSRRRSRSSSIRASSASVAKPRPSCSTVVSAVGGAPEREGREQRVVGGDGRRRGRPPRPRPAAVAERLGGAGQLDAVGQVGAAGGPRSGGNRNMTPEQLGVLPGVLRRRPGSGRGCARRASRSAAASMRATSSPNSSSARAASRSSLVVHVGVERRCGHPEPGGQAAQRQRVEPALDDEVAGRRHDGFAREGGAFGIGGHPRRRTGRRRPGPVNTVHPSPILGTVRPCRCRPLRSPSRPTPPRTRASAGSYAPVFDERSDEGLRVTGELPAGLAGTYLRNGPNHGVRAARALPPLRRRRHAPRRHVRRRGRRLATPTGGSGPPGLAGRASRPAARSSAGSPSSAFPTPR